MQRTNAIPVAVVRLEGVSKSFGPVKANQDITFDIHAGKIVALLGENGAGKSTLMSMLAGRYRPDAGRIVVDGVPVRFDSSKAAIAAGIGMVYQHFMLVDTMTVAQNVLLGQEGGFFVRPSRMEAVVGELARRYGLSIDPAARVSELSMGERQRVEILKLLYRDSRVLIFDEPTAVLTPPEIDQLMDALKNMAARGKAIVFISHKLQEVLSVADEIVVLRQGRVVAGLPAAQVRSKAELASLMVGREVILEVERAPVVMGEVVLAVDNLVGRGLAGVSFELRQGEVLAVVGVAGNGQKALVEAVAGLTPAEAGSVRLAGAESGDGWRGGLSYVPEDRLGLAACPELNMVDNVLLTTRRGFTRLGFLDRAAAARATLELVQGYNVQPPRPSTAAGKLSGGNLQKLVLAREFFRRPRVIVAEQPTQGLDVSATEEVWRRLLSAREHAGVLLVTGDLNEALQLADRIAVIFRGRFMDVFSSRDHELVSSIGLLMAGVHTGA